MGWAQGGLQKLWSLDTEICDLQKQWPAFPEVRTREGGKGRGVLATILPTPVAAEAGGRKDGRVGRPRCGIQPPLDLRVRSGKPCPEPRDPPRPWAPAAPLTASLRTHESRTPRGRSASRARGSGLGGRGAEVPGIRGHAAAFAPRGNGTGSHRTVLPRPRGSRPGLWDKSQSLGLIVIG